MDKYGSPPLTWNDVNVYDYEINNYYLGGLNTMEPVYEGKIL